MAYVSEAQKIEQKKKEAQEQIARRKRMYSRDVFLQFMQKELRITLTAEQKAKFLAYIKHRFDICQCCVLYGRSENVRTMLQEIGLPQNAFGTAEFIIAQDFSVRYSPDYKRKPLSPVKATYSWGAF